MQRSASLSHSKFGQIHESKTLAGIIQPWEVRGFTPDAQAWREGTGFVDLSAWKTIEIAGKDARDFLHRMTTVNFKELKEGDVYHGAFLTGRGTVVALGYFSEVAGSFNFLCPPQSGEAALEHLTKFHFGEPLTITDRSNERVHFAVTPAGWKRLGGTDLFALEMHRYEIKWEEISIGVWRDDTRPLIWLEVKGSHSEALLSYFEKKGFALVGQRVFEFERLNAGVPESGKELTEKDIILEGNFDRSVARAKGCYPGQEVVERIFTYGQVNRKLFPVETKNLGEGSKVTLPKVLLIDGQKAGELLSWESDPLVLQRAVGLAYIQKKFWDRKEPFSVEGTGLSVTLLAVTLCSAE